MELRARLRGRRSILLALALQTLTALFGVSILLQTAPVHAAQTVPYKVNFQGRFSDNSGNALSDGLYNVKFRLWTLASGGTNQWEEDRVITGTDNRIQLTNGLFNIQFGDLTAITPSLFNTGSGTLFLEVELPTPATSTCAVNGCAVFTEGAMTPRQPLASSPYAINSQTLNGLDSTAFAQLTAANTFTAANLFSPGASAVVALTVKASTGGATNGLEVFDSANTRQAFFNASGQLNVGQLIQPTTNNATDLGVVGAAFRNAYVASIDSGTTTTSLSVGTVNATAITIGRTAASLALESNATLTIGNGLTAHTIQIGTGANVQSVSIGSSNSTSSTNILGGVTGTINLGSVGASTLASTTNIANTTSGTGVQAVAIGSEANAANTVDIDGGTTATGIQIGNSITAHGIQIGAGAAAAGSAQSVVIGSPTTTTASAVVLQGGNLSTTNNTNTTGAGVIIGGGFSTVDTNLVGLTLDSTSTFAETANTCTAAVNGGSLYYNATTNAIRSCISGGWEDVVTTAGLGILAFGVVPDSGANPGDLPALGTPGVTGPCKVSWLSATSVTVAPCTAYSGGRKVLIPQTNLTLTTTTAAPYENVCLTGVNSVPALVGPAATQTSPTIMPALSINNPILCLATLRNGVGGGSANGSFAVGGGTAGNIYDVRTFTNSVKEFETSAAALGLGYIAQASTTGVTTATLTLGTAGQRGIVVVSNGAASAGGAPNVIIATSGPAYVVATAGTAAQSVVVGATTASFAVTSVTTTFTMYAYLGLSRTTFAGTCTSAATCLGSLYTDLTLR